MVSGLVNTKKTSTICSRAYVHDGFCVVTRNERTLSSILSTMFVCVTITISHRSLCCVTSKLCAVFVSSISFTFDSQCMMYGAHLRTTSHGMQHSCQDFCFHREDASTHTQRSTHTWTEALAKLSISLVHCAHYQFIHSFIYFAFTHQHRLYD